MSRAWPAPEALGPDTSQALGRRRDHQEFLRFLKTVQKKADPDLDLHFILDNYATHTYPRVKAWLEKHSRVHFHFLPTSASWMNLFERFFSELTQLRLKRLAVSGVPELEDAIHR